MRLRLVSAVIALVVCSAANANCMREIFGDTICGQDHARMTEMGRFLRSRTFRHCRTGRSGRGCLRTRQLRTRHPLRANNVFPRTRGDAVRTLDGVRCLGGCEPATSAYCERIIVE
ncbi:MAG: hypothetical protein CM15mP84_02390 [Cellvibrionales bacterium]|nr:MAG: hypothetical protein CM15mP84_02390 [Cellvibrionales bacterium]